jgi:glycine cleavage system aminomethyltransferase T
MPKFMVQGRDAGKVLDTLSANDVDGAVNRVTYTPWLNEDGKLEVDLTVAKLEDETFWSW